MPQIGDQSKVCSPKCAVYQKCWSRAVLAVVAIGHKQCWPSQVLEHIGLTLSSVGPMQCWASEVLTRRSFVQISSFGTRYEQTRLRLFDSIAQRGGVDDVLNVRTYTCTHIYMHMHAQAHAQRHTLQHAFMHNSPYACTTATHNSNAHVASVCLEIL